MCKIGSPLLSFLSCSLCTLLQKELKKQYQDYKPPEERFPRDLDIALS